MKIRAGDGVLGESELDVVDGDGGGGLERGGGVEGEGEREWGGEVGVVFGEFARNVAHVRCFGTVEVTVCRGEVSKVEGGGEVAGGSVENEENLRDARFRGNDEGIVEVGEGGQVCDVEE